MSISLLYQENLKLGYRINSLNDENNFYRISINNIKKLNQTINQNILKHHQISNNQSKQTHQQPNQQHSQHIANHYNTLSNKIQLKNLQIKVGTYKRKVDKMQRVFQGSISTLAKQSQQLQKSINKLSRQYEFYNIQNEILQKQFMVDIFLSMIHLSENSTNVVISNHQSFSLKALRGKSNYKNKIDQFQDEQIKLQNKLEQITKEQKQLKKQKSILLQKIKGFKAVRNELASKVYCGKLNIREAQALQVDELKAINMRESQLWKQINQQEEQLEHQYKTNQQLKQRILDRNQQENKQIKVLQQQIKKCGQQVKQIKFKCEQMENKYRKITKNN